MSEVFIAFFGYVGEQNVFIQWCALWLLWIPLFFGSMTFKLLMTPYRAYNRTLRSRNIANAGWPPEHLDADGDWKPEPEE